MENLYSWNPNLKSKTVIRTTPARFFVDPSIACGALNINSTSIMNDVKYFGNLFECLVIRDLRVYSQVINGKMSRYKDNKNLEIDVIITLPDGRWGAFEVKLGSNQFDDAAKHLLKLANDIDTKRLQKPSFLAIISSTEYSYKRDDGVLVLPLGVLKP